MNLGRRKALSPTLNWIEEKRSALEQGKNEDIKPLALPFIKWCQTLKIKTPDGLAPFTLFDWQRETSELITGPNSVKGRTIVVLSSRQTGKTSLFLALGAYLAQSVEQFSSVYIHRTGKDSGLLARRLKRFLSGVKLRTDSLGLIELLNDSMLHFRSANPTRGAEGAETCGRGLESLGATIVEEAAFLGNLQDVLGVIGPAMTWGNPKLSVLISTAGSKTSFYYSLLAQSAGGEEALETLLEGIRQGTEKPFQILNRDGPGPIGVISNWRCIPEFATEPNFLKRVQEELNLSDAQISSEYEMAASATVTEALFDFATIVQAQSEEIKPYEQGERSRRYIGVDPAGVGQDYAVAVVLRRVKEGDQTSYEVCGMYRRRTGTSEQHLSKISDLVNEVKPSKVLIEKNSMGQVWLEQLAALNVEYEVEGFSTTQTSKEIIIGRLQLALERGDLRIPKGIIVDELLAFRRDANGKLGAVGKAHDDCVIALAIALTASGYGIFKDKSQFPLADVDLDALTGADAFNWLNQDD